MNSGKSAGINPFEIESEIKKGIKYLNIHDKVAEIRSLIATICRNYGRSLSGLENTEIEIIVNQLYADKRYYY